MVPEVLWLQGQEKRDESTIQRMSDEEQSNLLEAAAAKLGEHFDTVQIFVTRVVDDGKLCGNTEDLSTGLGNWYARTGQVRDWLTINDEMCRKACRDDDL